MRQPAGASGKKLPHARKVATTWLGQRWQNFRELPLWKKILIAGLLGTAVLLLIAFTTLAVYAGSLSSEQRLMNRNSTGVTLVDRNNKKFYEFYNPTTNNYVELNKISEVSQEAIIAAEDQNFYEHNGFSVKGLAGAVWQNIRPGGLDSGGSTITQQLVKNALLTSDRSYFRKYQELVLAIVVEQRYSKDKILEMYLNSVYFGEGHFGIEDAARGYYGVAAKDLNTAQAATLMGVLPAPGYYSPVSGEEGAAESRREYVLDRMAKEGFISQEEADQAKTAELSYLPQKDGEDFKAPHFALMIKNQLIDQYGEQRVARSGFIVKTSLDLSLQTAAQQAVANHVNQLSYADVGNGSAVAIDPKTGEILALVGSKNYNAEGFGAVNMATTPRQPGSSFKPIVYATGIEEETITAATIFNDKPTNFGGYEPKNYDLNYWGKMTTRTALANSRNVPAVEAQEMIGVDDTLAMAEDLGITTLDETQDYGLSLALGTGSVKLTELTNAYATFANQGEHTELNSVLEITNKYDERVFTAESERNQAISAQTSYIMSSMLSDDEARARSFGGSLSIPNNDVAVKTGTTEDYADAWTVGYTPSIAVGVWTGNNDNSPMQSVAGSVGSGPIWSQIMIEYLNKTQTEPFSVPSGLETAQICAGSGAVSKLDFEGGQPTYTEYFLPGTLPNKSCNTERPEPEEQPEARPEEEQEQDDEEFLEEEPSEPLFPDDGSGGGENDGGGGQNGGPGGNGGDDEEPDNGSGNPGAQGMDRNSNNRNQQFRERMFR